MHCEEGRLIDFLKILLAINTWFLRSGKVRENQSTRVQKLTKMRKKFELFYTHCVQQLNFFLLAICISTFKFVPPLLFLV